MSNFAILPTDPQADLYGAVNYLLATKAQANVDANLGNALLGNTTTGQITTTADPNYLAYLYQYINIRYADSADGSVNFSTSPTNRNYFGVRNSTTTPGSSNPADYVWTQVVGGFGTTKFLYYQTNGGRQIQFAVSTTPPGSNFIITTDGQYIDLDVLSASLVGSTIQVIYSDGQVFNKDAANVWSPADVGNVVSTVANISVIRSNAVVAEIGQTISYDTVAQTWSTTTNPSPNLNPGSFSFGTNVVSASNFYQPVYYADVYANLATAETVTVVTSGADGAPGANGTSPVSLTITYNAGQFFTYNTDGSWSPAANANGFSTTTSTITAIQGNTVVGQLTRTLSLDTTSTYIANSSVTSNANISGGQGNTTPNGAWRFSTFTSNGTLVVTGGAALVDIMLVGPGVTTNGTVPGAGDAGEFKYYSNVAISAGTYPVVIGRAKNAPSYGPGSNTSITLGSTQLTANTGLGYTGQGSGGSANLTYGGVGSADPWGGQVTWISNSGAGINGTGNVYAGGVAYYAAGGAPLVGTPFSGVQGYGGLGGGGGSLSGSPVGAAGYGSGGGYAYSALNYGEGSDGIVIIRQSTNQQNLISNLWVFGGNSVTDINPDAFGFGNAVYTVSNYNRLVTYFSNGAGNVSGIINASVVPRGNAGTNGTNGNRGFIPMAYVVTASDPTTLTNVQLTTAFSAPRSNVSPPIGTGFTPITGDTAQFVYRTTGAYVVKTYNSSTAGWTAANAQVIDGNVIVTGSISSAQLNANDIYALNIASTNANIGNVASNGFWLQSNTGDARFGGNLSVGANLNVSGLITASALQTNTVNTTTITTNAISTFGAYSNNADSIVYSPAASTYYALTSNVVITTTVANTKASVFGQSLTSFYANVVNAPQSITANIGILITDSTGTSVLTQESLGLAYFANGNVQQNDFSYYETGSTINLANVDTYTFRLFSYYVPSSANISIFAQDSINRRLLVQTYKR